MGLVKCPFQRGYVVGPREVIKCKRNVDLPDLFGVARLDTRPSGLIPTRGLIERV